MQPVVLLLLSAAGLRRGFELGTSSTARRLAKTTTHKPAQQRINRMMPCSMTVSARAFYPSVALRTNVRAR